MVQPKMVIHSILNNHCKKGQITNWINLDLVTWCLGILEQTRLVLVALSEGGGWDGGTPTPLEDCSLVFTTSKGHVTTAPAVPATLKIHTNISVSNIGLTARELRSGFS